MLKVESRKVKKFSVGALFPRAIRSGPIPGQTYSGTVRAGAKIGKPLYDSLHLSQSVFVNGIVEV